MPKSNQQQSKVVVVVVVVAVTVVVVVVRVVVVFVLLRWPSAGFARVGGWVGGVAGANILRVGASFELALKKRTSEYICIP